MYSKKDIIYSSTMGLCLVKDVTKLSANKGPSIPYYVLRSIYETDKVSYIPVEEHEVELRELIGEQAAKEELEALEKNPETCPDREELLRRIGEIAHVLGKTRDEIMNCVLKEDEKEEI